MTTRNERLVTGYSGRLLLAISLGWAFIQAGRLALPNLLPAISAELSLSPVTAGASLTVLWGIYALLQYPSGRLSDQLTRKTPLVVGVASVIVGMLLLSIADAVVLFFGAVAVIGFGAGLFTTAARALVSDLFVAKRGQAFGIHGAAGDFGGVVGAGLAVAALALATWRAAFVPVAVVLVLVAVAVHVYSREAYVVRSVNLDVVATVKRLLGDGQTRWLLVAYVLYAFVWQGSTGFLPTLLQVDKGFSPGIASGGFAAMFLVGTIVKPVSGRVSDAISRPSVAAGVLSLGAAALVGVALAESTVLVLSAVVAFAVGLMAYPPVMQAHLMDVFADETMGGDLGGMRSVYIGVGSLGPTSVGAVAEYASYEVAFLGLAGCLGVAVIVLVGLATTRHRER